MAPVEFMTTVADVDVMAERYSQSLRPIDHRREFLGGRQTEPDHRRSHQVPCLHHCIGEVSCADHDGIDFTCLMPAHHLAYGRNDPRCNVGRGWRLCLRHHAPPMHEHGVSIRAADINP